MTLAAVGADGGTAHEERTVLHNGTRIGGLQDPAGDDNGPGTYTYPTNPVYVPGAFDLTAVDVYDAGDKYAFVSTIAGNVTNPWGGQGISHQRINVYLSNGDATATPALPGTNVNVEHAWDSVVVTDGRFDGAGVYGPDGTRTSAVSLLAVPEAKQIVTMVPKEALGTLDPASAKLSATCGLSSTAPTGQPGTRLGSRSGVSAAAPASSTAVSPPGTRTPAIPMHWT